MTDKQFDNARFHKGQRATIRATVAGVNFERGRIMLRLDGKATLLSVPAADVTLED